MFIEIGRLTREVEVKTVVANGIEKRVLNNRFAVRVNETDTAFIDVTAWNGTADFIARHFKKGDELFIEGELRNRVVKADGGTFGHPFVLITRCRFTHGNRHEIAE
ncbi:MAG: single-stranded DNA-binding protein [Clostridiales Family XIII bacterium]|jgi:single-stranded DNA-binding protein|nr:single-stranded DNA-binding protein [Clostridiales Family XIII bacterium]